MALLPSHELKGVYHHIGLCYLIDGEKQTRAKDGGPSDFTGCGYFYDHGLRQAILNWPSGRLFRCLPTPNSPV